MAAISPGWMIRFCGSLPAMSAKASVRAPLPSPPVEDLLVIAPHPLRLRWA